MGARYELTTVWRFDAALETVWDAVLDVERWPQWWGGVVSVVTLDPGDAAGLGARRRVVCRGALPFRVAFVSVTTRIEPLRLLEGRVTGDVDGVGRCHFVRTAGGTLLCYEWHVRTARRWMNVLAPLARPVLAWNHQAAMRAGGAGLAHRLAVAASAPDATRGPP